MQRSRLPAGGANIFQKIRQKRSDAEAAGLKLIDLSIGEPKGPALRSAREAAKAAVISDDEAMHAFQRLFELDPTYLDGHEDLHGIWEDLQ